MLIPTKNLLTRLLQISAKSYVGGMRRCYENKKSRNFRFRISAVRTGLEPATPCVTGMYSNQLNYRTIDSCFCVSDCKGTTSF